MRHFVWRIVLLALLSPACSKARGIDVDITYSNLSDSYIYPYRIAINGTANTLAQLLGCSNGTGSGALIMKTLAKPPRFIVVEWEHLVSRKVYRARIELGGKAGEWWHETPFRGGGGKMVSRRPVLVIQWRGPKSVAAMLVADFTDFAKGTLDLGMATGTEIERPSWGPKNYLGYSDFRRRSGDDYRPGAVARYERRYDNTLTNAQRFGCPRLPNGRLDESRLPPEKLPYVVGADGEHIPCEEYFCSDKQALIKQLRKLGWRRYPEDGQPPAIEFRDAPNPRPAR